MRAFVRLLPLAKPISSVVVEAFACDEVGLEKEADAGGEAFGRTVRSQGVEGS